MKQCLLLMIVAMTWGCTSPSAAKLVQANNANMAKLSVGMAKTQVLEIMSPAGKTEAYETKSGGKMELLFYRTQIDYNFDLQDKHWTPICIIDGNLKGWGNNYYDDVIKIRKEIIKKDN